MRLRVNDQNHPEYLSTFLNTGYAKRMLRGMCKSIIGMANINATEVQAMRVLQPPLALQREFARRVTAVEKLRTAHRASLAELDAFFAAQRIIARRPWGGEFQAKGLSSHVFRNFSGAPQRLAGETVIFDR